MAGFGARYPALRQPVVERTIQTVAQENALFAVATALPDVLPSLMELPWAFGEFASDTAFLTGNQVRMAFQIAAAYGREAGFVNQKGAILSIVAGAFGWRALARELVGKIPLGGGLIPKGAIAYAGTLWWARGLSIITAAIPAIRAPSGERFTARRWNMDARRSQRGCDPSRDIHERRSRSTIFISTEQLLRLLHIAFAS